MGKIEAYFKKSNYINGDYYHKFIVWMPDIGPPRFIRGGLASGKDFGLRSGGGSGSASSAAAKDGVDVSFGAIQVDTNEYDKPHARDWAPTGVDPSQVIITGSHQQLEPYWKKNACGKRCN